MRNLIWPYGVYFILMLHYFEILSTLFPWCKTENIIYSDILRILCYYFTNNLILLFLVLGVMPLFNIILFAQRQSHYYK